MIKIPLKKYGAVLTGRPYGAQAFSELEGEVASDVQVEFDFTGVASLGSSFGEEVLVPFAKRQNNNVTVYGAIAPVRACVQLIAKDFGLKVEFK